MRRLHHRGSTNHRSGPFPPHSITCSMFIPQCHVCTFPVHVEVDVTSFSPGHAECNMLEALHMNLQLRVYGCYTVNQDNQNPDTRHCMQMHNMPYTTTTTYHQQHNAMPYQNVQPTCGSMGGVPQSMCNQRCGTPVTPSNAYTNHNQYASHS